jgi:hypothetical protein
MVQQYTSNKKLEARHETITQFRSSLVGTDLQYWTLAGPCAQNGQVIPGCEFDWAVQTGLVAPSQFHGVDHDSEITEQNTRLPDAHWYCGDFFEVLRDCEDFNPGFVNCDLLSMPKTAAPYLAKILYLVKDQTDCVVVANFLVRIRYFKADRNDIVQLLAEHPLFRQFMLTNRWQCHDQAYEYNGNGDHNRTRLCSIVFHSKHP